MGNYGILPLVAFPPSMEVMYVATTPGAKAENNALRPDACSLDNAGAYCLGAVVD